MFTIDTLGFMLISFGIAWLVLRRKIIRVYPTDGYFAGELRGRKREIYGYLWIGMGLLALVLLGWAISGMLVLALAFPFLLERD